MYALGFKNNTLSFILITFFLLLPFTTAYAKRGCCSHHGGVVGCDAATGMAKCKDGTTSPSCNCSGATVKPAKTTKTKTTTTTTTTPPTTTTAPTTTKTPASKDKGCCARHGGVAGCNKATGYQMCKDGSQSPTCKCN